MSYTHTHIHARTRLTSIFIVAQARKQLLSPHVAGPPRHSQKPEGAGRGGAYSSAAPAALQPFCSSIRVRLGWVPAADTLCDTPGHPTASSPCRATPRCSECWVWGCDEPSSLGISPVTLPSTTGGASEYLLNCWSGILTLRRLCSVPQSSPSAHRARRCVRSERAAWRMRAPGGLPGGGDTSWALMH